MPENKNLLVYAGNAQFAKEMISDDVPYGKEKFLGRTGEHLEKKDMNIVESNVFFWRSKEKTLYLILALCTFCLFAILLGSSGQYTDAAFSIFVGFFNAILKFVLGAFGL